jgi:hypothetical protein
VRGTAEARAKKPRQEAVLLLYRPKALAASGLRPAPNLCAAGVAGVLFEHCANNGWRVLAPLRSASRLNMAGQSLHRNYLFRTSSPALSDRVLAGSEKGQLGQRLALP